MADILAAPQQAVSQRAAKDEQFRTLGAISVAHWVSHFQIFVLPMLFPFLKQQLNVGYVELGFALTVFAVSSGLTQAPIGYLADHLGARKILLAGLCLGGGARVGRAFSIHTFAGFLGGAMAPAIIAGLVATIGGHGALIAAGAVGPLV